MSLSIIQRASVCISGTLCLSSAIGAQGAPDVTLRALLDTVALRYPGIEAASLRVRAAEASRRTAGSLSNPMASYQVDNASSSSVGQPPAIDRETMTMLTVPLEPLYQRGPRVRQADALVRAAVGDAEANRQTILRDATHAFYRVARSEARLAALRDVASWLDTLVAYNRSRVQEGVTAEADLIRTQLERDRAMMETASQQAELSRACVALRAFLAVSGPIVATPPSGTLHFDPSTGPVARPELRAAAARVDAANAAVGVESRMLFRELGATVGTKQMMGTTSMVFGLSMPLPLFDQNRGDLSRARAERDAGERELVASTRMIESEYAGAVDAARILTDQVDRLGGDLLARAEQAERIALGAYREGAVSLLQVLDASRARSEARIAYYGLLYDQHESVIDLLFASGQDIRASLARLNPDLR